VLTEQDGSHDIFEGKEIKSIFVVKTKNQ